MQAAAEPQSIFLRLYTFTYPDHAASSRTSFFFAWAPEEKWEGASAADLDQAQRTSCRSLPRI